MELDAVDLPGEPIQYRARGRFTASEVTNLEAMTVGRCTNCGEMAPIMALGAWLERRGFVSVPGGGELVIDERKWRKVILCSVRCVNRFESALIEMEQPRWAWTVLRASWAATFTMGDANDWRTWRIQPEETFGGGRPLDDDSPNVDAA